MCRVCHLCKKFVVCKVYEYVVSVVDDKKCGVKLFYELAKECLFFE